MEITYLAMPSDGCGKSELLKHILWVGHDDPYLVHSALLVGNIMYELKYDGASMVRLSDAVVEEVKESVFSLTVDATVDVPRNHIADVIERRFLYLSKHCKGVSFVDAFRTFFRLPTYGHTCHSFIMALLGLDAVYGAMPIDVIKFFILEWVRHPAQVTHIGEYLEYYVLHGTYRGANGN